MQHPKDTRTNIVDKFPKSSKANVTAVPGWLREGSDGDNGIWSKDAKATALFSYIIFPQTTRDPRSMKFKLFDKTPIPAPSVPVKQLIIPSMAYDDPAFSPDPHSNPFFASDQQPEWDTSLPPGHPTLRKLQPSGHDDFHLLQPPNTPAVPDAPNNSTSTPAQLSHPTTALSSPPVGTTHSSTCSPSSSSAPAPASSASLNTHVRPKYDMPHDGHHPLQHPPQPSPSKPEHKKRSGLFSRLIGSSSSVDAPSSGSNTARPSIQGGRSMIHSQDPPPYEPVSRPIPQHTLTTQSAPEMYRSERPALRPRANTAGIAEPRTVPVAAAAAASRVADDHWERGDLDRIDELDESNPFGTTWHHGGPYEAISRVVQKDNTAKHSRAQAQSSSIRIPPLSHDNYRTAQLMALKAGSLNLKPGQILPHDFASYPELPLSYSLPQPQPTRTYDLQDPHSHAQLIMHGHEPRPLVDQPMFSQLVPSAPRLPASGNQPGMEPVTDPRPMRHRSPSPAVATTHSDEDGDVALSIGIALMGDGQNNSHERSDGTATAVNSEANSNRSTHIDHNIQSEALGQPPAWHTHPNPPPARSEFLRSGEHWTQIPTAISNTHTGVAWNGPPVNIPPQELGLQPVPPHKTSPQPRHTSWHPQPVQLPLTQPQYTRSARQEIHNLQPPPLQQPTTFLNPALSRSATYAPELRKQYTNRHVLASSLRTGDSAAPPSTTPSIRDREADTRSIQQSIITTSNVSSRSQDGENHRRNRYLPKRLVMPTPLQPTMENQPLAYQARFDPQANAVHPRDPSPPQVKPPMLATQPPRAQDIPIAPSNKLRKRMSLIGGPTSSSKETPAVAAVSFSANILPTSKTPMRANTEKLHKRVLNKKR